MRTRKYFAGAILAAMAAVPVRAGGDQEGQRQGQSDGLLPVPQAAAVEPGFRLLVREDEGRGEIAAAGSTRLRTMGPRALACIRDGARKFGPARREAQSFRPRPGCT